MNYFSDNTEWQWLFKNVIDWDKIIPLYYPSFPTEDGIETKEELISFLEEILSNTGQWCGESVTERAEKLDRMGAGKVVNGKVIPSEALLELYKEAQELEIFGLSLPTEYGGMGLPATVHMFLLGQLSKGCVSSSTQLAFFASIAELVYRFCDKDACQRIIPKIVEGTLSGSMCLTEPGCGSDLGAIKTTAVKQEDGSYILNGSKLFITNAGGGVHLTLARSTESPDGIGGISLFLLEQETPENSLNYQVVKNEDKMGMHGSFTCEVLYENSKGHLVGNLNEGFKYMLFLMNEARLAVGIQALGLVEATMEYAEKYTSEREQFGKPIKDLPLLDRNLKDDQVERDALRALMVDSTTYHDIYQKIDLKKRHGKDVSEKEEKLFKMASKKIRKRTPLVKYYGCEAAVRITTRGIQYLGGYGYMKEYPVERIHRDSFGPLLYEGTSQIQALMALKDLIKEVMKNPATLFKDVVDLSFSGSKAEKDFKKVNSKYKKNLLKLLYSTLSPNLSEFFNLKNWQKSENIDKLMTHAETLCQAMSYIETLELLYEHTRICKSREDLFFEYQKLVIPRLEGIYADWSIR